jgi:glucose 1-dehydrogenase
VLKEITDAGGNGITYQCDVSKEDQVIAMFQDVVSQFGTVDILINNAGIQKDAKFTEMTLDQWNAVIGVNLTGQFLVQEKPSKNFSPGNRSIPFHSLWKNYSYQFCA